MHPITAEILALIITEITGTITPREQELLNLARQQFAAVKALSDHLHNQGPYLKPKEHDPERYKREAMAIIQNAERGK